MRRLLLEPNFRLDQIQWWASRPKRDVTLLEGSLAQDGQTDAIMVWFNQGRYQVHPGKARVQAAENLGWETLAAVIFEEEGTCPLGTECSLEVAQVAMPNHEIRLLKGIPVVTRKA